MLIPTITVITKNSLFCFVPFANQILSCLFGDVSPAKLIGTNPGNRFFSGIYADCTDIERNAMLGANLVSVMAVQNDTMPDANCFPTSLGNNVLLQLLPLID